MSDRPEINEATTRIESHEDTHRCADLGDLSQLGRKHETRLDGSGEQLLSAIENVVVDFSQRIRDAAKLPGFSTLINEIDYMASKGEPLYILIRDAMLGKK